MSTSMGGFTNNPVTADNSFAINSKIMIVAVVVLFGVVMFILALHIYAKWFWRHGGQNGGSGGVGWRRRRRLEFAADWPGHQRTTQVGLEKSVLDQLPTFTFTEKAGVNQGDAALECAVCLEEFAEGEKGRLLPKCSHSFHIECIDMWFHSHSTCPLCRCSVSTEDGSNNNTQEHSPPSASMSNDGILLHAQSGDVVIRVSDAVARGDYHFDQERAPGASSATVAVVEHRPEFPQSDSGAAGAGLASSPRQLLQGSRPASPSGRRSSTVFSPKPTGIQFPANVLFWGNQAQMNAAGAVASVVSGGPRDENVGRRRFSSGVHAPNSLVIEIPRPQPLDSSSVFPALHQSDTSGDEPHRASDAQGRGPRSPIGRLVSSSFRRLLSIRRGPTSPGPEGNCSNFEFEQQQQGSSGGATSFQVSS